MTNNNEYKFQAPCWRDDWGYNNWAPKNWCSSPVLALASGKIFNARRHKETGNGGINIDFAPLIAKYRWVPEYSQWYISSVFKGYTGGFMAFLINPDFSIDVIKGGRRLAILHRFFELEEPLFIEKGCVEPKSYMTCWEGDRDCFRLRVIEVFFGGPFELKEHENFFREEVAERGGREWLEYLERGMSDKEKEIFKLK